MTRDLFLLLFIIDSAFTLLSFLLQYYFNVRTRQKFYSKTAFYIHFRRMASQVLKTLAKIFFFFFFPPCEPYKNIMHVVFTKYANDCVKREVWLNRETAEEEKDQMCSRCKEIGHNCTTCPYPIIHKIVSN